MEDEDRAITVLKRERESKVSEAMLGKNLVAAEGEGGKATMNVVLDLATRANSNRSAGDAGISSSPLRRRVSNCRKCFDFFTP
jgi:hypothetical protein